MCEKDIISDEAINSIFEGTNFGAQSPRQVLASSLLKCACGYHSGRTATEICYRLGLVTNKWTLTDKGKTYLYEVFEESPIVKPGDGKGK